MAATDITTRNGLFKPEIMKKELLRNLDNDSVWLDLVNRDYEGEIKKMGDTVKVNQAGDVAVRTYVPGTDLSYDATGGKQNILRIDQYKYFAFKIEDIDEVQANINVVSKYFDRARTAITLVKDTYLFTKAWAGIDTGNIVVAPSGGLTKANIYGKFLELRKKLRWANAIKANGKGADGKVPYAVVDPDVLGLIMETDQVTHATQIGDENIRKGTIVRFAGFDIKETTNEEIATSGDDAGKHKIIAGTTEAITYADQILKTRTLEDKSAFAAFCSGLYVFGSEVFQPKCLAGLETTIA